MMAGPLPEGLRERLLALAESKHVTAARHPALPLTIFNYTHRTQYERLWTPETLVARGLILADDGTVVARPFPKFFNLEEHAGPLPAEPFMVWEKLDGSLFILARYGKRIVTATRGSFTGPQANLGRTILFDDYDVESWADEIEPGLTYCFELICPESRVVVDYGGRRDLVHLATLDNATGRNAVPSRRLPTGRAEYVGSPNLDTLHDLAQDNEEGFVVHFTGPSNLRLKVKFAEYVRLHRLLTGVSERSIWMALRNGDNGFFDLLERAPNAFRLWARAAEIKLRTEFSAVEKECRAELARIRGIVVDGDRRSFAAEALRCRHPQIVFLMLDGKDHSEAIWKAIRPETARPFREDEG